MRWKKRDKERGEYIKRFLIFPKLYDDTWCWFETVYLFRRFKYDYHKFRYVAVDELVSKEEYDYHKECERNERKARKEKE